MLKYPRFVFLGFIPAPVSSPKSGSAFYLDWSLFWSNRVLPETSLFLCLCRWSSGNKLTQEEKQQKSPKGKEMGRCLMRHH